jgi:lysine-specific demethylase 3
MKVANMADCIKIAIDFVSPENIDRCEKLTKEFREQNQSKVFKEDVLQLRTMMWFAWQSCSILEVGLDKEEASAALTVAGMAYRNPNVDHGDEGSGLLIEGGGPA